MDEPIAEDHGVSLAWFEVLAALRAAGGSLRAGELAIRVGEQPSTLSHRLVRMVDDGLIERAQLDSDRRTIEVRLTSEGRAVWRDANVAYRRAVQTEFARHLTDTDVAALARILGKLETMD
jgi:DNA-binding MarR family transcriptional regulator